MSNYIPDLYDKESKVQFFYNEFKRRDANPEGFDCKMKNWITSINKYCDNEDRFLVDMNELRKEFECMSIRPQVNCLKLVVTNMIKERKLLPLDEFKNEFLHNNSNNGWINWGFSSVKKTIGWFSSSVSTSTIYTETIDEQLNDYKKFVNLSVFDRIASNVVNYVRENGMQNQILKFQDVESELCSKLNLDKKHRELIIQFLECKGNCKTLDGSDRIIKFEESDATITDKELSLMKLEDAKQMIEAHIEKLEDEIEKCKEEAREAIKQNNKTKGMNILKKKARLTQQLDRKNNQYDNIEVLEDQLLSTDSNEKVLDVLLKSTQVLKAKQTKPEDVDDLLCTLEETIESNKNLTDDLSKPFGSHLFNENELKEELKQLIEEDEIERIAGSSTRNDENRLKDRTAYKSMEPNTSTAVPDKSSQDSDELYERLRKLKSPPTANPTATKRDKVRYALFDDDL